MMTIPTFAIRSLLFLVISIYGCESTEDSGLFEQTFNNILSNSVIDSRYNKPPTFEEFKKGEKPTRDIAYIDSLAPLEIFIEKIPIQLEIDSLNINLPEDYHFVFTGRKDMVSYISQKKRSFKNEKFEVSFLKKIDYQSFFKNEKFDDPNFGGILQFSKALINDKKNKAVVLKRWSRSKLESIETLILFKKIEGKWKVLKYLPISMS
ncbi:hypothetical protein [Leeuwenhoekiella blandensis]|nr:hypothetical protein [Leeuwenhoekiella blandensis]